MRIKSIQIKGFRNLKSQSLDFDDSKSVFAFVGDNGQGKTNILESIYLCALSKSFRTKANQDLVGFDQDFAAITTGVGDERLEVIVTKSPSQKALKVNGVKRPAIDFIGHLKAVFFSPDDLSHMAYAPKLRRRYIDVLLSQLSHDYLDHLMRYEEAKRKRNSLLKYVRDGEAKREELIFWDEQLASHGLKVIQARTKLMTEIEPLVQAHYQAISQSSDGVSLNYQSELKEVTTEDEYLEKLRASSERDIASGKTQLGPHRDDIRFDLNDRDMQSFASRGEWRSLVLSLKFAEIDLIKMRTDQEPVLLLDDVFSELDHERQKYLIHAVKGAQTFITTTHQEFVDSLVSEAAIFKVHDGLATG